VGGVRWGGPAGRCLWGLASDSVLRLRRTREERVGAWMVCVGELLEDGVLRVGVSGTLVSMRIGPGFAWEFQGTRGELEWLEGALGTCSGHSAGIRLAADA